MFNLNRIFVVFISLMWLSGSVYGAEFVLKAAHNGSAGHPFDDGYQIEMYIESGTLGSTYRIEILVTTDASQILEGDGILYITDQ